jgi:hypothetical protein
MEIHNDITDTILKHQENIDRNNFVPYLPIVEETYKRVKKQLKQDGNAGAYYKVAGEMMAWGGNYENGKA